MWRTRFLSALALLAICCTTCDDAEPQRAAAQPVRQDLTRMRADLIAAYRDAHEQGDVEKFLHLLYLEGAERNALDFFLARFETDRKMKVAGIHIEPVGDDEPVGYEHNGVRYAPNLPPAAWLRVVLDTSTSGSTEAHSTRYLLGIKGKSYRIAVGRAQ